MDNSQRSTSPVRSRPLAICSSHCDGDCRQRRIAAQHDRRRLPARRSGGRERTIGGERTGGQSTAAALRNQRHKGPPGQGGQSQIVSPRGNDGHCRREPIRSPVWPPKSMPQCRRDGDDHQRRFDVQPQSAAADFDGNRRPSAALPWMTAGWGWAWRHKLGDKTPCSRSPAVLRPNTFIRTSSTKPVRLLVFTGLDVDVMAVGSSPALVTVAGRQQQGERPWCPVRS